MTLQQLRYILEVYHAGSFSKAAANLYVTRPSLSLTVKTLETELGYPIFIRTQNGLLPSPRGEVVLEYASRICATQSLIKSIGQESRKHIDIQSISYEPINRAFRRLLRENSHRKDISFSFNPYWGSAFKKLSSFEVDCAFSAPFTYRMEHLKSKILSHNLQWQEWKRIPVYICIGPGHRLYNVPDVSPRDFENDTLLDTASRDLSRCTFLKDIINFNRDIAIASQYTQSNYEILEEGLAFKICRRPAEKTMQRYKLRCIPIEGVSQQLLYSVNPTRPLAPEAKRFAELVQEELATYDETTLPACYYD